MSLHRDPQRAFEKRLRLVLAAGITLPEPVTELQERLRNFTQPRGSMRDRITDAIINGTDIDLETAWGCALAEAHSTPALRAEVFNAVRASVNAEIRDRFASHATGIYAQVAEQFDAAAAAFTAAVGVTEPETPAELVLSRPAKEQKAWRDAGAAKADLDGLLPILAAAAQLAGFAYDDDDLLPLSVDPGDCHRRRVWEAWEVEEREEVAERKHAASAAFTTDSAPSRSRTGRWGAVLAASATIRACPAEDFEPYRRPKPMVVRTVNGPTGPRRIMLDPEDPDYTEPAPQRHTAPQVRVG